MTARDTARVMRLAILVAGWASVVLGLFLSILQGMLFICVGGYLPSVEPPWVKHGMDRTLAACRT